MTRNRAQCWLAAAALSALIVWEVFSGAEPTNECGQLLRRYLSVMRSASVSWDPLMESGTAVIDTRSSSIFGRLPLSIYQFVQLLTGAFTTDAQHGELPRAIECFLANGAIAPGTYPLAAPGASFSLTDQHILLLKELRVEWMDYYHAPAVNPKRPFGDMTFFELDMNRILGIAPERPGEIEPFTTAETALFTQLHRDMQPALEVFLRQAKLP